MAEQIDLYIEIHQIDIEDPELDELTRKLCREISELDVEYAKIPRSGSLPVDAKGDPVTIGTILVALASAGVFTGLIEVLKSWLLRKEGRSITIKAEDNGRKLEMTFSPAEASEKEMADFAQSIMGILENSQEKK